MPPSPSPQGLVNAKGDSEIVSNPFRYYELVDWIGNLVIIVLIVAAFLLVWREWRRANRIGDRQAAATERHADATDRLAAATETALGNDQPPPGSVDLETLLDAVAEAERTRRHASPEETGPPRP